MEAIAAEFGTRIVRSNPPLGCDISQYYNACLNISKSVVVYVHSSSFLAFLDSAMAIVGIADEVIKELVAGYHDTPEDPNETRVAVIYHRLLGVIFPEPSLFKRFMQATTRGSEDCCICYEPCGHGAHGCAGCGAFVCCTCYHQPSYDRSRCAVCRRDRLASYESSRDHDASGS
jgi:hypothetical protein